MALYRKKPVVIEAEQYLGEDHRPYPKGVCDCGRMMSGIPGGCQPHVHTIHDNQRVDLAPGDWIIPEPDGIHFYPCKQEIFEATYEPADAASELDIVVAALREQVAEAKRWIKHYKNDPAGARDYAFWDGKERAYSECLHLAGSMRPA